MTDKNDEAADADASDHHYHQRRHRERLVSLCSYARTRRLHEGLVLMDSCVTNAWLVLDGSMSEPPLRDVDQARLNCNAGQGARYVTIKMRRNPAHCPAWLSLLVMSTSADVGSVAASLDANAELVLEGAITRTPPPEVDLAGLKQPGEDKVPATEFQDDECSPLSSLALILGQLAFSGLTARWKPRLISTLGWC
jgi:hypothetical protein